jgi:2-dehydro-3-deoxyphosphogluconate aldolase/(4S)-4-hydroxy-2-oxoglutarate aldolase
MDKEKIITRIKESGLVAVVRAQNGEDAIKIAEACIEGGVAAIELTFTVPMVHKIIEQMALRYTKDEIILGAGTVLDPETARIAMLSGAQYIVSPSLNLDTVKLCNRYRVLVMPGVVTPAEGIAAMEAGADILKVFPGELFGPKIIRAFKGPLPQAQLLPTGGVDPSNVGEWIKAGAIAVGAGSALTKGDYKQIVAAAKTFIKNINEAREALHQ